MTSYRGDSPGKKHDNRKLEEAEFFCPYCQLWMTDTIHRQDFHNDLDEPDEEQDCRLRIDGEVYEDEDAFRNRHDAVPELDFKNERVHTGRRR